jgi:lysophospholipase L1-like esterase
MPVRTWGVVYAVTVAALVSASVDPSAASPPQQGTSTSVVASPRDAWVVGDSITYRSHAALRSRLRRSVDGPITIAGRGGRKVSRLDDLVAAELRRPGTPDIMVLALGTNPDRDWRRSDLDKTVDAIPDGTEVVLVTVFRTWRNAGEVVARRLGAYSRWMRSLAASRANVCVADWRATVSGHAPELLVDGVHPTSRGQRVWARVIGAAVDSCR